MIISFDKASTLDTAKRVAYIEPYYGGSHKSLIDILRHHYCGDLFAMRAKKWHWRVRSASLTLSQILPNGERYHTLFVSSMVNLAELLALRPDYARIDRKVIYVHENQFEYPKQYADKEERDYFFLHTSISSCLCADVIAWNSTFNMNSFIDGLKKLTAMLPLEAECKPDITIISKIIKDKSIVIPVPIDIPRSALNSVVQINEFESERPLRIGFPHRWEHDKNPDGFLNVLNRLVTEARLDFTLMIFGGETYEGSEAKKQVLASLDGQEWRLEGCGRIENREDYLKALSTCDVVVSTAIHEFFGVAMIEAARLGCRVLCPKRLSYPELIKEECLYTTDARLFKMLKEYCEKPQWVQRSKPFQDLKPGVWSKLDFEEAASFGYDKILLPLPCVQHSQEPVQEHKRRVAMISFMFMVLSGLNLLL